MTLHSSMLRNSLFLIAALAALAGFFVFAPSGFAQGKQEKQDNSRAAAQTKPDASPSQKQSGAQAGLKPMPRDEEGREAIEEGPDFLKRRQDWFFQPRAFPLGFIPQGARQRALERMHQMLQNEGRLSTSIATGIGFAPPGPTTSSWQFIGPQATSTPAFGPFTSGRVTALAVNPNNASNVYLGGADGGLWVSTDGGTTWTALAQTENPPNTGIPTAAVGSLALDATSCGTTICTTVYVGTGEDNFGGDNIYGEGVLKCTVTAGPPLSATCTQDSTFHLTGGAPLDQFRGGPMIGALAVDPKSNLILLAGVRGRATAIQSGIYCSADAGVTWKPVFGISGIVGTDVAFASDGTAFVALGFPFGDATNNGIYKSKAAITSSCPIDPSGTAPSSSPNWTKQALPAGTPAASLGRITLAIFPSAASTAANATVYVAIADSTTTSSNLLGVIKTTNGGTTWTQLTGDPHVQAASGECNSQCFYDMALAVSPASANDVFFGGAARNGTLTRSLDGGTTWTEISRNNVSPFPADSIHFDMHAIAFSKDGSTMYVGNDGGVWKTTNPTGTAGAGFWTNLNQNLGITQFYPGASIHPSNTGFSMGGTQDNDVQVYQGFTSPSANLLWNSAQIGCDGGFTAIDFKIPSTSFGECEYLPNTSGFPFLLVTFAGDGILGNGFVGNSGINGSDRGSFIPPFVMDPTTPTTLYFGTCRVWKSVDQINSWNAISPDVTTSTHPAGCAVPTAAGQPSGVLSTIVVAPSSSNTVYAGADNGEIEVTTDGATWTSIVTATLPTRAVTQIVVDPSNAAIAYAAFSGFGTCATFCSGPTGHVFKTMNGTAGAATVWTDISVAPFSTTGLPDIPVNAIVIDPTDTTHNTIYVGTDIGAFFTNNGGVTWSPLGAAGSIPNAQILSLALHNPSRTLRAATHGRGMWDLNLGGQASFGITSISPFTATAPGTAFTLTVNGNGFVSASSPTVNWNGSPRTTTFVNGNQLTASILGSDVAIGAATPITVTQGATTSNSLVFTTLGLVPTISSISPTTVASGASSLLLTVNGSNFQGGTSVTQVLFNGVAIAATATIISSSQLTVQVPGANLTTPGTVTVTTFNPPPGGGVATITPQTLTITAGTGAFSISGTAVTATAGSSGTSTITVTPAAGATGTQTVNVTCPAAGLPAGVTCSPSPLAISFTNTTPASGTLTLSVLAPSTSLSAWAAPAQPTLYAAGVTPLQGGKGWWGLSGGTGLAAILLVVLPGRKRYRAAMGLGLACVLSFVLGCGGKSASGPVATTTKIAVANTKVGSGTNIAFTITVTASVGANGQVQLFDGTATLGAPVTVSNGSATINNMGLAPGTHSISAHYLGDSATQASQSGTLNVTVTGTTTFTLQSTPAASNGTPMVNITIQ